MKKESKPVVPFVKDKLGRLKENTYNRINKFYNRSRIYSFNHWSSL